MVIAMHSSQSGYYWDFNIMDVLIRMICLEYVPIPEGTRIHRVQKPQ